MIFKIGTFNKFEAKAENTNPYVRFYKWLVNKAFPMAKELYKGNPYNLPPDKFIDVSKICLNPVDEEKLYKIVKKWARHNNPTSKGLDIAVAMLRLDVSPKSDKKIKQGFVKIEKGFIRKKDG